MSEQPHDKSTTPQEEEVLAKLLNIAGPRAAIPPNIEARVYSRVLQEWTTSVTKPDESQAYGGVLSAWKKQKAWSRGRRWAVPLALAASLLIAVTALRQPEPLPRLSIGTMTKVAGTPSGDSTIASGVNVYIGDTLTTGPDAGLSLLLTRSESLRIGANTTVRVDAADQFTLQAGRLYADTGEFVYRDGGLVIETSFGSVTDIGTQFAVTINDDLLDVAVREGRVDVQQDLHKFVAIAGEGLLVSGNGNGETYAVAPNADYWNWVAELAPTFSIEGRSLLDFLKWVARESGMQLAFESDDIRMAAMRTDLHGSIADFTPRNALQAVLPTTSLQYRIEGRRILIHE
jgi:ferric-dicitrate binding protein FerR (iron transport regulator)